MEERQKGRKEEGGDMFTVGHFISRYKTFELVTAHLQKAAQTHC